MKWLPLPKIAHAIAIYPFSPLSLQQTNTNSNNSRPQASDVLSTTIGSATQDPDDASIHTITSSSSSIIDQPSHNAEDYSHLTPLEVGDELFIIEQQGQWYRGYVLSTLEEGRKPNNAPIGCFPRSHVQVKEYIEIDLDEADSMAYRGSYREASEVSLTPQRPVSEFQNTIPRSFSETYILDNKPFPENTTGAYKPARPSSFGDLNFDVEEVSDFGHFNHKNSVLHIPPPPLPLARFKQSSITGISEPLVDEIAACVSEWNSLLYTYVNNRQYQKFNTVRDHINYLFQARRQLLDQALSREELVKLRKEIVNRMVVSNLEQSQEMIIRHPEKGYLLDATNASLPTIYRMHWKYALFTNDKLTLKPSAMEKDDINISASSTTNTPMPNSIPASPSSTIQSSLQSQHPKGPKFYHLFFELKACVAHICQPGEFTELYFALYSAAKKEFLTEQYVVVLNYNGMPVDETQIGKMRALFVDLSSHDINDRPYLVCHIVRLGGMKIGERDYLGIGSHTSLLFHNKFQKHANGDEVNGSNNCRRPFGCAVLELSNEVLHADYSKAAAGNRAGTNQNAISEYDMSIYTATSESNFTTFHEDIISKNTKEVTQDPRAEMLRLSIRSFYGFLDDVLKTNAAVLQDVPHTLRLGFADVAFPDDSRNELYITLDSGDFSQFGRSRNIQVTMYVCDGESGKMIEDAISVGSGARPVSYWDSMVMYHEQRPKWSERIKINLQDVKQWKKPHVVATVKHRSSNDSGNERILAMAFLPLFLPSQYRDVVADGSHTLHLYKCDNQIPNPKWYLERALWCDTCSVPSNTSQQAPDSNQKNRPNRAAGVRKFGHRHSPSDQSSRSLNGLYNSGIAYNTTSAATSTSDVNTLVSHSSSQLQLPSIGKLPILRDTITVTTFLCSNVFTQNENLVKLLNWRALLEDSEDGAAELLAVLGRFIYVGEVEVVKFLGGIFDSLLDILAYEHEDSNPQLNREINEQVLSAIVWLLGIVQDRRFSNFRPVLDVYIENRFSLEDYKSYVSQHGHNGSTNHSYKPAEEKTSEHLLKSLSRLYGDLTDEHRSKLLRNSIKVWGYLFRFIVRSRIYQSQLETDSQRIRGDNIFNEDIDKLLKSISSVMDADQPSVMIGTQTLALQHFADILVELHKIFTPQQVSDIAISFVHGCSHVTGRLVGFKLAMILSIVKGPTFNDYSCRLEMAENVFRWIRLWINSYMATAKDVVFARQVEQQRTSNELKHHQTRLPKSQWIENLRLSLTIISEILDKVRTSAGMASSGLNSAYIPSAHSRPTSFAGSNGEEDANIDSPHSNLHLITEEALQLIPQLLNAYKDLQKLTVQAIEASKVTATSERNNNSSVTTASRQAPTPPRNSRHSFSALRERASSFGSVNKTHTIPPELLQEGFNASQNARQNGATNNMDHAYSSLGTAATQALATSPSIPFPQTYPFQPSPRPTNNGQNGNSICNDHSIMIASGLLDLTVVILELFYLAPRHQWVKFIRSMYEHDGLIDTTDFLRKVVYTCMGILFGDSVLMLEETSLAVNNMSYNSSGEDESRERRKLPTSWLNLSAISHQIVLCHILEPIKNILDITAFIPTPKAYDSVEENSEYEKGGMPTMDEESSVDYMDDSPTLTHAYPNQKAGELARIKAIKEARSTLLLWRVYFVGFLRVLGSPKLEIAKFMPQVQRAVWKIIGNMCEEVGAKSFLSLWSLAGKPTESLEDLSTSNYMALDTSLDGGANKTANASSNYFTTLDMSPPITNSNSLMSDSSYFGSTAIIEESTTFRKNTVLVEEVDDGSATAAVSLDNNASVAPTPPASVNNDNNATSNVSVRNSVRIGPTDETLPAPLSSIHEEFPEMEIVKAPVPFLQADLSFFILNPLCSLCLSHHDRVRFSAITVIADIIAIELCSLGELSHVRHACISTFDRLVMSDNKGDELISEKISLELNIALEQRFQNDNRRSYLNEGKKTAQSICRFLSLLLQIRSLPADNDEFMDERITATLKLMKFIQVIEREEIYIKYVHQLVQLHLNNHNFIEAALTLQFHADLLRWVPNDRLAAIPELNLFVQSSFSRKEALYEKMIGYLDQGNAWELCIQFCKELAYEYENTLYDYSKLSGIVQRQAGFVENIAKRERCFTEYFRVGFYGRGFPAGSRNRQFIYRGLEWEKTSSFVERMQNRHPNAQILPSKIANAISIQEDQLKEFEKSLDGQYLQITSVTPLLDADTNPCLASLIAPDYVKKYYNFNNVSKFSFSRPVTKESVAATNNTSQQNEPETVKQPESDFLNLWTEKVDFECEDKFPTIVRRSMIIGSQANVVSPIENAVTAMENKNKELESLERKYAAYLNKPPQHSDSILHHPAVNINPFSMSLNGAVDAPVNGGVPLYKKAFLTKTYWQKNPEMRQWIHRLRTAIHDQVRIIQKCLEVHNKLVSAEMRPFHTTLTDFFYKNFAEEIKLLKEKGSQELPENATPLAFTTSNSMTSIRRSTLTGSDTSYSNGLYYQTQYDDNKQIGSPMMSRQNTSSNNNSGFLLPTPGLGSAFTLPTLPTLPVLSPISRSFSIRTPLAENPSNMSAISGFSNNSEIFTSNNSVGDGNNANNITITASSMSRGVSQKMKVSLLNKRQRKKSQVSTPTPLNINNNSNIKQ